MDSRYELLEQGLAAAFIDQGVSSNLEYKPQFVSNDYREGRKVISSIEDEINNLISDVRVDYIIK